MLDFNDQIQITFVFSFGENEHGENGYVKKENTNLRWKERSNELEEGYCHQKPKKVVAKDNPKDRETHTRSDEAIISR